MDSAGSVVETKTMSQFDSYSNDYSDHVDNSVRFSGKSTEFFHQTKAEILLNLVTPYVDPKLATVLDVGCGTGLLSELIAPRVRQLMGADISASSLKRARERLPSCRFETCDGATLPFPDRSVDLAFASCVMHHVPPKQWSGFVAEMARVVKPGGSAAVIEHNPWNPLTRMAVSRCEFDKDAVLLFPSRVRQLMKERRLKIVASPFILFFPWRSPLLRTIESKMGAVPIGAQYIVMGRKAV